MEKKYLPHLTGFRAIAAYLILITHSIQAAFSYGDNFPTTPCMYVTYLAALGMSVFFVLSGFVITYTYYDRFVQLPWWRATWDFAVARFARLYPLYILCLLCDIQQRHYLMRHARFAIWASYLTLTQSWWHKETFTFSGAWSISTECFFYVCFAFWMLFPRATRHSSAYIRRMMIITLAGFLLILAAEFWTRADITAFLLGMLKFRDDGVWSWWFEYVSPYVRVGEFIAGVCAARMFMVTRHEEHLPSHQKRANILCILSCAAIIAMMAYNLLGGLRLHSTAWITPDDFPLFLSLNFGYAPFLAYLFYACSRYPNILTRLCSTRLMQMGGEISYSVYLLQFEIIRRVLPHPVAEYPALLAYEASFFKVVLYILLTTMAAFCTYRLIEVPARRLLRNWFSV